jgi:LCP family protein required for cell wall assembly
MARITAGRKARQRRALLMASTAMSSLVLLAAACAFAVTSYVNDSLSRVNAGTGGTPSTGPLNILVAGLDERTGLTRQEQLEFHVGASSGEVNTDTLMVVHVPASHKYVEVVSLPRDSWVSIPGHGMNKINAALGAGGPQLMVSTVEHATGLTINDYVEINFLGFIKVINALGGVNICLPYAVNDPDSGLSLSAGTHHVDGVTALEYARDRHSFATSDLARIQDQQQLISTAISEGISAGTLADPVKFQQFLSALSAAVRVDSGFNVVSVADALRGLSAHDVTFTTVPLSNANYTTPTGESAVQWNSAAATALFNGMKHDQPPGGVPAPTPAASHSPAAQPAQPALTRGQVSLDVYNGTMISRLSSQTGASLSALGFKIHLSGVDWTRQDITQTLIQYPAGQQAAAQLVQQALPGSALQQVSGLPRVRILLGQSGHSVTTAPAPTPQPTTRTTLPAGTKTAAQEACR